jgi:hypothetical protein
MEMNLPVNSRGYLNVLTIISTPEVNKIDVINPIEYNPTLFTYE